MPSSPTSPFNPIASTQATDSYSFHSFHLKRGGKAVRVCHRHPALPRSEPHAPSPFSSVSTIMKVVRLGML